MHTFYKKFLAWHPIAQMFLTVGPLITILVLQETGLPDSSISLIFYYSAYLLAPISLLIWPLAMDRIVLIKAPEELKNQINKYTTKLPLRITLILLFSIISVVTVASTSIYLSDLEVDKVPYVAQQDISEFDRSAFFDHFSQTARYVLLFGIMWFVTIACFVLQMVIYSKLAWRNAIILNSVEKNRFAGKDECKRDFWLFFAIPIGVWIFNKRLNKILE